jgi:succinoglycan biosynthesis protein ExoA
VIVVSAGRLSPEKGTEFFIRAMPRIAAALPTARFLIFGSGPRRAGLGRLAMQLGVADRIRFAGLVAEFPSLVRGVDLVVNPSLTEEMPNVLLEAMAAQVPVIATAVGGVPELADAGRACRLVPAGDVDAIAAAAIAVLVDPKSLASLGQAGYERVQTAFSPQRQQQQLRSLYTGLLPWLKFDEYAASHPDAPFVSVVMPVRNEESHIGETLEALIEQDYPADRCEILVADGNSTDGTRAVVEAAAGRSKMPIRWLANPGQLSSAGRNAGVRAAKGDIITIVDGHCEIPGRHLLADTARIIHEQGADALCRPQPLFYPGNSWFQDLVARVRATALGHGRDSTIYSLDNSSFVDPTSSGATYRREVFEKIGYFDESFDACEDVEFNHRVRAAGLKAFIDPSLAIFYRPRHDSRTLFQQLRRYGKGRVKFLRKHPDAWSLTQLLPAGLVIAAFVGVFSLLLPGVARIAAAAPLALYLLIVIAWSVLIGLRHGIADGIVAVWIYLTIHFGLGLGFLSGIFAAAPERISPEVTHRRQVAGRN